MGPRYSCSDGMCGADDCVNCGRGYDEDMDESSYDIEPDEPEEMTDWEMDQVASNYFKRR